MEINKIIPTDCLSGLKLLPDNSVDCVVTSPPYFGLRDYGIAGQIGLEETPEQYIAKMLEVFNEVRRVLKPTGTLWLNIGDTYAAYWGQKYGQTQMLSKSSRRVNNGSAPPAKKTPVFSKSNPVKPKDLFGIPWMMAFALRAQGWYLRQDIIWHKPNPMPESVTDRCTKSHEYIFLLSKSPKYYFDSDSIRQPIAASSIERLKQNIGNQNGSERVPGKNNGTMKAVIRKSGNKERKDRPGAPENVGKNQKGSVPWEGDTANKKSVWTVATMPFQEAHFATFPEVLIVDCIKAGCPEGGVVLDPFMGAGTTAVVARKLNRNFIGFEINEAYIKIAEKRLHEELGMFL